MVCGNGPHGWGEARWTGRESSRWWRSFLSGCGVPLLFVRQWCILFLVRDTGIGLIRFLPINTALG